MNSYDMLTTIRLDIGETVLWRGRGSLRSSEYLFSFMPISLLVIGVLATAFTVITTGLAAIKALIGIWIGLVSFVALNLSAYQGAAKKLQYALTDKRIWALYPQRRGENKTIIVEYEHIEILQYYYISAGSATLKFLTANEVIVFYEISDAATVVDIIAKGRGQQPADFEALFTSRMNSDPFIGILHQGESILWQGQPKRSSCAWSKNVPTRFYTVTNQRLLLLDFGKFKFFAEADLAKINKMSYEERSSGVANLSYGGPYGNYLNFESLPSPGDVLRIINEAKQQISGEPMGWVENNSAKVKTK